MNLAPILAAVVAAIRDLLAPPRRAPAYRVAYVEPPPVYELQRKAGDLWD